MSKREPNRGWNRTTFGARSSRRSAGTDALDAVVASVLAEFDHHDLKEVAENSGALPLEASAFFRARGSFWWPRGLEPERDDRKGTTRLAVRHPKSKHSRETG